MLLPLRVAGVLVRITGTLLLEPQPRVLVALALTILAMSFQISALICDHMPLSFLSWAFGAALNAAIMV
jgi:hypothetical protein